MARVVEAVKRMTKKLRTNKDHPVYAAVAVALLVAALGTYFLWPSHAATLPSRGPDVADNPTTYDVLLQPGQLTQAALNAHPSGTRFALAAGLYRVSTNFDVPTGDQLLGFIGAVISGGKDISSGPWTSDGAGHWYIGGQTPIADWVYSSPDGVNVCGTNNLCHKAYDVWLDHAHMTIVGSIGAVGVGDYYFDTSTNRIYIGTNPAGHLVETNNDVNTVNGRSTFQGGNVLYRNLVFEEFGTNQWSGAIGLSGTAAVDHCKVWLNHMDGVSGYDSTQVTNSVVTHNGEDGVVNAVSLVDNNEIGYNNENGFNIGWNGAGLKFANPSTSNVTIQNNWIHNNYADGVWMDTVGTNIIIQNNTVENNDVGGIGIEVGPENIIRNNIVRGNGYAIRSHAPAPGWWWVNGVGIGLSDSSGAQVYNNYVYDNANGPILILISYGRTNSDGAAGGANNNIHDNYEGFINTPHALLNNDYATDSSNSMSGALCTLGTSACNALSSSSWSNNHYYAEPGSGGSSANWWVNVAGVTNFSGWQSLGRDTNGSIVNAVFPSAPSTVGAPNPGSVAASPTPSPSPTPAPSPAPYSGTAPVISSTGSTKLEAENYDTGGEGVGYHDGSASCNAAASTYRGSDCVGVKDNTTGLTYSNGHAVGYFDNGDWLNYTVSVPTAGTFSLAAHGATVLADGKATVSVDGSDKGTLTLTNTNSWTTLADSPVLTLTLSAGTHQIRVTAAGSAEGYFGDVDYFTVTPISLATPSPTPTPIPGGLLGDLDGDGHVTGHDVALLLVNWNKTVPPNTGGDLDGNGIVNGHDVALMLINWGK